MQYAACKVPAAPVRRKPRHQSEMTNQLLFGETVEVLKLKKKWAKVRGTLDGYEGWISIAQLEETDTETAVTNHPHLAAGLLNRIETPHGIVHIPTGSTLPFFENGNGRFGKMQFQFRGTGITRNELFPSEELLRQLCLQWLHAPYLWGGRTVFGVDCSGFVQVNYKMMGIDLKRDAWQQAKQGGKINTLEEAKAGDLAFFDDKDEIVHVGILLSPHEIIHASGTVRIDKLDEKGIVNADSGKRTHRLKTIRRFF